MTRGHNPTPISDEDVILAWFVCRFWNSDTRDNARGALWRARGALRGVCGLWDTTNVLGRVLAHGPGEPRPADPDA